MHVADASLALDLKAKLMNGLADPSRLVILEALREGPLNVGEIVEATGLLQPNASSHLSCLHGCGLVIRQQRGRYVYYQLRDERVSQVLALADDLLRDVARGVYTCVHNGTSPKEELAS